MEDLRGHDWPAIDARLPAVVSHAVHALSGVLTRLNVDLKQVVLENAQIIGAQATAWATYALRNIVITLMNAVILGSGALFRLPGRRARAPVGPVLGADAGEP